MDEIKALLLSVDFRSDVFWKAACILAVGTLLLGVIGRFIFGKKSVLNQSVSSAIGIIFVYAATVAFRSLGGDFERFVAPLPMVSFSGEEMHVFAFAGTDYTIICTQVLSMIILAFLANLIESILPKGKHLFGWLFFRCLSVVLAIFAHLAVDWFFRTYLPEGLVTYAPTIVLALLILLLLVGALKLIVGAVLATVNPLIGAFYTFFFATLVGKALAKAILTAGLLCGIIAALNYIGCASVCIASAALIAYIPLLIVLLFAWYVVGHLL
ncbi:MAG: hypothetical protein IJO31_04115 [Oscillospiraceae bacterium]|nr:hypothetical protein [Oscillospiraceae bacterium]